MADKRSKGRERRRQVVAAKTCLRDLRIELVVLNHRVAVRVALKDIDFDCLDVITRHGPLTPSSLAARVGVHVAATRMFNRLEAGGWISGTVPRETAGPWSSPDRQGELYGLFDPMNTGSDEICAGSSDEELNTIVDFLQRAWHGGCRRGRPGLTPVRPRGTANPGHSVALQLVRSRAARSATGWVMRTHRECACSVARGIT